LRTSTAAEKSSYCVTECRGRNSRLRRRSLRNCDNFRQIRRSTQLAISKGITQSRKGKRRDGDTRLSMISTLLDARSL